MAEVSLLKVLLHDEFKEWLTTLRDPRARAQVAVRLRRLELGNPGEFKPLGGGVTEMKINYGPGYRVDHTSIGTQIVVVLCGGDKTKQDSDIAKAKAMVETVRQEMKNENN